MERISHISVNIPGRTGMRSRLGLVAGSPASRNSQSGRSAVSLHDFDGRRIYMRSRYFGLNMTALLAIVPAAFLLAPRPIAAQKMATEARNTLPSNAGP